MTSAIFFTVLEISLFKALLSLERFSTSFATMVKPRPASPARAVSMLAFNASIFCFCWMLLSCETLPSICLTRDSQLLIPPASTATVASPVALAQFFMISWKRFMSVKSSIFILSPFLCNAQGVSIYNYPSNGI